jgi:magnesium transporter
MIIAVTDGHYRVTQIHEPTTEAFYDALSDAGLEWPDTDILERHRHPGLRIRGDTMALILHPVSFDESSDAVSVVQVAMVLGQGQGVVARWSGDGLDDAFAEPMPTWRDLLVAVIEHVHDIDTEALATIEERVDDCELEVLSSDGHGTNAQTIYHLEHELLVMRRAVSPMVVVMDRLGRKSGEGDKNIMPFCGNATPPN